MAYEDYSFKEKVNIFNEHLEKIKSNVRVMEVKNLDSGDSGLYKISLNDPFTVREQLVILTDDFYRLLEQFLGEVNYNSVRTRLWE